MDIQNNKRVLAGKTIFMDPNAIDAQKKSEESRVFIAGGDQFQSMKLGVLGGAVAQAVVKDGMAKVSERIESEDNKAATDIAVQNAEGKGMEEAKRREDERLEQEARSGQPKRTMITETMSPRKSHVARNALVIGGLSSAAIVGGSLVFPFFGAV